MQHFLLDNVHQGEFSDMDSCEQCCVHNSTTAFSITNNNSGNTGLVEFFNFLQMVRNYMILIVFQTTND